MIKKYGNKILTSVSFTGIAISNVKASNTPITVVLNNDNYFLNTNNGKVNKENITSFETLINQLKALGNNLKKGGANDGQMLDLANIEKEYFVKSVKIGNDEKLTDITNFVLKGLDINDNDKKLIVELVKKSDKINITYDDAAVKGGRLKKAGEKKILENFIQGKGTNSLGITNVEFKIGNLTQADVNNNKIGKDINLFANAEKVKFEITKITADYKTVVCNFATNVEKLLVAGIDLEKLCVNSISDDAKLSVVIDSLNKQIIKDTNDKFFKADAPLKIHPAGDTSKTLDESITTGKGCKFLVIENIKESDINPIFLKKTFSVEFDKTGVNKKTVKQEIIDKIKDALNTKFKDVVKISVQDIINEIYNVKDTDSTKIIKSTAFNSDLNNISITGVSLYNGSIDKNNSFVDNKNITIKLKAGAFAEKFVETEISLTFNAKDIKRGSRKLNANIITAIEKAMKEITTKTTKTAFINKFKVIQGLKMADNNNGLVEGDFNFTKVLVGGEIGKDGEITLNDSGIEKLNDSCFEPDNKPKTNNSSSSGSGNSGEQKESTSGCCCKKKTNNAQKEDKKDKKS